jgi:hypothetical protein
MNICDDNHEEVCYEGRDCPLCESIKKFDHATEQLNAALGTIDELKNEIETLKENQ